MITILSTPYSRFRSFEYRVPRAVMVGIATAAPEKIVLAVISHLNKGEIDDALALFADQFSFKDHGIGLLRT